MPTITVVIVDDHHHILEDFHLAIRQRRLPFSDVHVVHVDAHPDLSFPSTLPCDVVFEPSELYEVLEQSESGIAEFLLPQVFAGHISTLTWVKPSWATQFAVGDHLMRVGRHQNSHCLRVNCDELYFIDEDLYVPSSEIDPKGCKTLRFQVRELHATDNDHKAALSFGFHGQPFVLDIDLDYFSTWNPFLRDFTAACGPKGDEYCAILTKVFTGMKYKDLQNGLSISQRVQQRRTFVQEMKRLETQQVFHVRDSDIFCEEMSPLLQLYRQEEGQALLKQFYDMLRAMDDRQRALVWWAGPCADLPSHESSMDEIQQQLETLRRALETEVDTPLLITIAKSVGDEYLPPDQAEQVTDNVLAMLRQVYEQRGVHLELKQVEYEWH